MQIYENKLFFSLISFLCLTNIRTNQINTTIIQTTKSNLPVHVVIKSAAFCTCIIHINQSAEIHSHKAIISLIHNETKINQKTTTSMKALGFAILAKANKTHDEIKYFKESLSNNFLDLCSHI